MYEAFMLTLLEISSVHAVVTKLSCSGPCVPQIVQYHCETDSMDLIWTQGGQQLGGVSDGYTVKGADEVPEGYNVTTASIDGGGLSSNITFLAEGKNETTIYCEDESANPLSTKKCSLMIAPVRVIENLLFTALSNNSALLYWTSLTVSPDCTAFYTLQVNVTNSDTILQTNNTTEPSVNVSSLVINTNYSYRVAGTDNAGRMGEWSVNQCFQLKVPGPVYILPVYPSDIHNKPLIVEWTVHESDLSQCVPTVNGYTYTVYTNNSLSISEGTKLYNQTTLTISDIQQGETYLITVIAINAVGEGEPAEITLSISDSTSSSRTGLRTPQSTTGTETTPKTTVTPTDSVMPITPKNPPDLLTLIASIVGATLFILILVIILLAILIIIRKPSRAISVSKSSRMDNGSYNQVEDPTYSVVQKQAGCQPTPSLSVESQHSSTVHEENTFRPMPPPPPEEEGAYSEFKGTADTAMIVPPTKESYSQLAGAHKKPKALPPPKLGEYAALGASLNEFQAGARQKKSTETVYAELGKQSKDAPIHLPYEMNMVVYSELKQTKAPLPATSPGQKQLVYADLQTASSGPPPALPPKPCVYSSIQHRNLTNILCNYSFSQNGLEHVNGKLM